MSCGIVIKKALDNVHDLDQTVALAAIWSDAFNRAYDDLRKTGRLDRAVPEPERISEVLNENFNPAEIFADHIQEVAVEHYIPRLAPLWKWAKNPGPSRGAAYNLRGCFGYLFLIWPR